MAGREALFQMSLAAQLSAEGHLVALRDAGTGAWPRRFSSSSLCPDLMVETNPEWILHDAIPVLAIEAKVGRGDTISDMWDGFFQLVELKKKESEIVYKVDGRQVNPVLYLFVNPCLLESDIVTFWHSFGPKSGDNCCASHFTRSLSVGLSRFNAGLLCKDLKFKYEGHLNGYQFSRTMSLRMFAKQSPLYQKR